MGTRRQAAAEAPPPRPGRALRGARGDACAATSTASCATSAPGETIEIPRGAPHQFWNAGSAPARAIWQTRPGGRTEQWFAEIDRLHREGKVCVERDPGPSRDGPAARRVRRRLPPRRPRASRSSAAASRRSPVILRRFGYGPGASLALSVAGQELVEPAAGLLLDLGAQQRRPAEQQPRRPERLARPLVEVEAVVVLGDQPVLEPEAGLDVVDDLPPGAKGVVRDPVRRPRRLVGVVLGELDVEVLGAPGEHPPHPTDLLARAARRTPGPRSAHPGA